MREQIKQASTVAKLIFWDFDGVIKESVAVKADAFGRLFEGYGPDVVTRVRAHHLANGGMSRFDKMPLYLCWAGEVPDEKRVQEFCGRFGRLALQGVIEAPWVPGAENYLRSNPHRQRFVLVSATPQDELEYILRVLDLRSCFANAYGAPTGKQEAIRNSLENCDVAPQDCLMIGDAHADLEAAEANEVPFLLRRHQANTDVFTGYNGLSIEDMTAL